MKEWLLFVQLMKVWDYEYSDDDDGRHFEKPRSYHKAMFEISDLVTLQDVQLFNEVNSGHFRIGYGYFTDYLRWVM